MLLLPMRSLVLLIGLSCLQLITATYYMHKDEAQPPRCYDCDYDPKESETHNHGRYKTPGGGASSSYESSATDRRGFAQCALDRVADDQRYVRETNCHSGMCFIRRDQNGLVYRGCADPQNLPYGVRSTVQCKAQGMQSSQWWFCNGTLCNSGQFGGQSGVCSPAVDRKSYGSLASQIKDHSPSNNYQPISAAYSPTSITYGETTDISKVGTAPHGQKFEQVQQNLGYGGQQPVVYGGTGLSSEQALMYYARASLKTGARLDMSGGKDSHSMKKTSDTPRKSISFDTQPETEKQTGSSKSYQSINLQSPELKPTATYDYQVESKKTHASAVKSNAYPKPAPVKSHDATETAMVDPPSSRAYKTWDFVVLANSKLHQLDDQSTKTYGPTGNDVMHVEAPQPYKMPHPSANADQTYNTGQYDAAAAVPATHQSYSKSNHRPSSATQQQASQYGGTSEHISGYSGYNQCDGQCYHNPSGLFSDPMRVDAFIQCGPGTDYESGTACRCCRPQRMLCPPRTTFDKVSKVCSNGTRPYVDNKY